MSTQLDIPALSFTASQIARAAGMTRQAVYSGLDRVPQSTPAHAAVVELASWRFERLPVAWQMEITRRAVRRGFAGGEALLKSLPAALWVPPKPWECVHDRERVKAGKLHKAMSRALALRPESGGASAQIETIGLDDFKAEFGYGISARHWHRLFNRTLERDGGEENWQRLEIYLDDRAFAASKPKRETVRFEFLHRGLDEIISSLENRTQPTLADRQFLWDAICRHYERSAESQGSNERRFKASLAHYLAQALPGTLSATEASLRRLIGQKLDQWRSGGKTPAALLDRRSLTSGNFRRPDFTEDLKKIRNQAIQLDGNEALANRMLRERGELSPEFCDYYPLDSRQGKSVLPKSVRSAISPEVEMVLPLRRGPWQAKMRGPYIPRDWSGVKPGDWFCADDVTWNHYFREQLPDGRWEVLRGECLVMTDLRTGYPLEFLLIPGKYNGEHVRTLALKVHDRVGLPCLGFYFERGVWQSRLVTGDGRQGTPVNWREVENGLCAEGLKLQVRHATTPRAKPIEGLFRILQERMRCIAGFVGFNERTDERERMQALIARAQRGDSAALEGFPTKSDWAAKISQVLQEFAHDPQGGKMLEGSAPAEAWAEEVRQRPLRRLPDESRYTLSTHEKRVRVRQEGILLTIRGKRYLYYNERTGKLIGREVLAFYNLEMPELLTVSDMNRQNYFSVRRVELPAMGATREQLQEVNRLRKAHMAPAKAIFGELRHETVSTITRDNDHTPEERELGRFHRKEMEQAKTESRDRTRKLRKLQVKAAAAGIAVEGPEVRNLDDALEAIDRRKDYREAMRAEEALD